MRRGGAYFARISGDTLLAPCPAYPESAVATAAGADVCAADDGAEAEATADVEGHVAAPVGTGATIEGPQPAAKTVAKTVADPREASERRRAVVFTKRILRP